MIAPRSIFVSFEDILCTTAYTAACAVPFCDDRDIGTKGFSEFYPRIENVSHLC